MAGSLGTMILVAVTITRSCLSQRGNCVSKTGLLSVEKLAGQCLVVGPQVSCRNRCGSVSSRPDNWMCSCDALCTTYEDCCVDFVDVCPLHGAGKSRPEGTTAVCKGVVNGYFLLVAGCPTNRKISTNAEFCESSKGGILSEIPVFDNETKVHYKNYYCAACNNVTDVHFWNFTLKCRTSATNPVQATFQELMRKHNDSKCSVQIKNRFNYERLCTENYINKCRKDCNASPEIVSECARYQMLVSYNHNYVDYQFKNPACAVCNNSSLSLVECLPQWPPDSSGQTVGIDLWKFSYSLLINVNPSGQLDVRLSSSLDQGKSSAQAVCEEQGLENCQVVQCQDGYENVNGRCQIRHILSKVVLSITYMYNTSDGDFVLKKHNLFAVLSQFFTWYVEPDVVFSNNYPSPRTSALNPVPDKKVLAWINVTFLQVYSPPCDYEMEGNKLRNLTITLKVNLSTWFDQNSNGEFENIVVTNNLEENCKNSTSDKNTDCARISFPKNWFRLYPNGSALFNNTVLLDSSEFVMENESVLVCTNSTMVKQKKTFPAPATAAMGIVTLVCLIISELCLLVRIILQFFVPLYRTFPGKLQLILSISLFMSNLCFMLRIPAANHLEACVAVGAFTQWIFLVYFFSMNVIAFDLWLTFRQDRVQSRNGGNRRVLQYLLYACTTPAIIVAITVGMEYSKVDRLFRPNFTANGACWLQGVPLLIYFGIPFIYVIISNVVFYILATISIRKSRELSRPARDESESGFSVYVKLCVLLGLTWTVAFLAPFVRHVAFDYVFIVLNTLHGVYIFIGFVCTGRVYNQLFKTRKHKSRASRDTFTLTAMSSVNSSSTPPRGKKCTASDNL